MRRSVIALAVAFGLALILVPSQAHWTPFKPLDAQYSQWNAKSWLELQEGT